MSENKKTGRVDMNEHEEEYRGSLIVLVLFVGALFLLSGCAGSHTFMKDMTYETDELKCKSKWVGILNSFPTGREDRCEEKRDE